MLFRTARLRLAHGRSARDARGPEEHEKIRPWSGAPPALKRDDDISRAIALGMGARRHDAGRIVLLDDQRTGAAGGEIGAGQYRRLQPAMGVAEIGLPRGLRDAVAAAWHDALRHAAALAQARP